MVPRQPPQTALGYGRFIGWFAGRGDLDPAAAPEDRVTRDRVRAYLDDLKSSHGDYGLANRLQELGDALRAMAPEHDWHWLLRASSRIAGRARPRHDKISRMRSPDELAGLGRRLMAQSHDSRIKKAIAYRDGFMIALLSHRPLRMRNLCGTKIECNLVHVRQSWMLVFTSDETKTGRPLELPFPAALVPCLEEYLAVHRPILLRSGRGPSSASIAALWVAHGGTPMAPLSIAERIVRRTCTAFGKSVNPHLFRDCAATAVAIAEPAQVRIITAVLGHATHAMSERHYNQARSLEASRTYGNIIDRLRSRIVNDRARGASPRQRRRSKCAP
jgi:integrase/recombinase XerD